jgi:hypothetical protein
VADLTHQGIVSEDDQLWFTTRVIPEAVKCGLKRLAAIGLKHPSRMDYYNRVKEKMNSVGVELQICDSMQEAVSWMKSFM